MLTKFMPQALTKPKDATIAMPAARTPANPNITRFAGTYHWNDFNILKESYK